MREEKPRKDASLLLLRYAPNVEPPASVSQHVMIFGL
jgi:hypothetical protein